LVLLFGTAFVFATKDNGTWNGGMPSDGKNIVVSAPVQKEAKVIKVTDGDTLHVLLDGVDEKVRLLGINTPETVDPRTPVQCFGKEASNRMKELAGGKMVKLEFDETQSTRDAYNRLLAYVYLDDGEMLNRKMIAEGYAYEYTYMTPYKYQQEFRQLQVLAKGSNRGLWSANTCGGSKTLQR
jgi:micrococcal nuclease